jgi:hypothetical protein
MNKQEYQWHLEKVGYLSASRAADLLSKSGKWIEGNIDYLYELQYQRLTGEPEPPISARPMQIGIDNEPYAIAWMRENYPLLNILHCDKDFDKKIFEKPWPDVMFGASPDAFIMSQPFAGDLSDEGKIVYNQRVIDGICELLEVKCLVSRKMTARYLSPTLPFALKKAMALKEHGDQMAAQLLAYPKVEKIRLLKYSPQMDDNEFDLRDVTDPTRGIVFEFTRSELVAEMHILEGRIRYADAYLNSGNDLEKINEIHIQL